MILRFLFFIQTFLKHCKALSTEKYKHYIHILLYYYICLLLHSDKIAVFHIYNVYFLYILKIYDLPYLNTCK